MLPDPTVPQPETRWTPEMEERLHRTLHDLDVRIAGLTHDGCHCNLVTRVALTALSDAGLLLTPQAAAVLEAARAFREEAARPERSQFWRQPWRQMADLCRAVDAEDTLRATTLEEMR